MGFSLLLCTANYLLNYVWLTILLHCHLLVWNTSVHTEVHVAGKNLSFRIGRVAVLEDHIPEDHTQICRFDSSMQVVNIFM